MLSTNKLEWLLFITILFFFKKCLIGGKAADTPPPTVRSLRIGRYRSPNGATFSISVDAVTSKVTAVYGGHYYLNTSISKLIGSDQHEILTLSGKYWGSKTFVVRDNALEEITYNGDSANKNQIEGKTWGRGNNFTSPSSAMINKWVNASSNVLWSYVERNRRILEAAIITNAESVAEKNRITKLMHRSFRNRTRTFPVFKWGAVESKVSLECPTEKQTAPASHTPSKIVGTTLAHTRIWQDFYRRHKLNNPDDFILIFEGDATCSVVDCGSFALEQLKATTADFVYLGWCFMNATEGNLATNYLNVSRNSINISDFTYTQRIHASHQVLPPVCLHAYALSVRAARFLFNNVYPCANAFGDWQVKVLATQGKLTWDLAIVPPTAVPVDLKGPRQTQGLWVQPW